jgi:hypothetical protein
VTAGSVTTALVAAAEGFCSVGASVDCFPTTAGEVTGAVCSFVAAARPVAATTTMPRQAAVETRFMSEKVAEVPEFRLRALAIS